MHGKRKRNEENLSIGSDQISSDNPCGHKRQKQDEFSTKHFLKTYCDENDLIHDDSEDLSIAEEDCIKAGQEARLHFFNELDASQEQNVHRLSTSEKYARRLENNRKSAAGANVREVVQRVFQVTKLRNVSSEDCFADAGLLMNLQKKLKTLFAAMKSLQREIEDQAINNIQLLENDLEREPIQLKPLPHN